ncbi:MAG TPA: hypothetical protein VFO85_07920, partial [Vicinamibacteria bacterium]|nr:hypothetical protein [Vicinamibacteria bacterium]
SREVERRVAEDPLLRQVEREAAAAQGGELSRLHARLAEVTRAVHSQKLGEVAEEFDAVHTVQRALAVGSVQRIVAAAELRARLIEWVEESVRRAAAGEPAILAGR